MLYGVLFLLAADSCRHDSWTACISLVVLESVVHNKLVFFGDPFLVLQEFDSDGVQRVARHIVLFVLGSVVFGFVFP